MEEQVVLVVEEVLVAWMVKGDPGHLDANPKGRLVEVQVAQPVYHQAAAHAMAH